MTVDEEELGQFHWSVKHKQSRKRVFTVDTRDSDSLKMICCIAQRGEG